MIPYSNELPQPQTQQLLPETAHFDVGAANAERLAARLGGEEWTERAAGRDESLARTIKSQVLKAKLARGAIESDRPD